eukprot:COSAG01_NODE_362_length_18130_cov_34.672307_9_plen_76_part_00
MFRFDTPPNGDDDTPNPDNLTGVWFDVHSLLRLSVGESSGGDHEGVENTSDDACLYAEEVSRSIIGGSRPPSTHK